MTSCKPCDDAGCCVQDGMCLDAAALQPPSPTLMLEEIVGHLGACQIQRVAGDDRIIAAHIDAAYALATSLLRAQRMSDSLRPHDISLQEAHWSGR